MCYGSVYSSAPHPSLGDPYITLWHHNGNTSIQPLGWWNKPCCYEPRNFGLVLIYSNSLEAFIEKGINVQTHSSNSDYFEYLNWFPHLSHVVSWWPSFLFHVGVVTGSRKKSYHLPSKSPWLKPISNFGLSKRELIFPMLTRLGLSENFVRIGQRWKKMARLQPQNLSSTSIISTIL